MLRIVLFIDTPAQTHRRRGLWTGRNTRTFGAKLPLPTSASTRPTMLTMSLQIDASTATSRQSGRTSEFAPSLLTAFALSTNHPASSAVLRICLGIDTAFRAFELWSGARDRSLADALSAQFARFTSLSTRPAMFAALSGVDASRTATAFACPTNASPFLADLPSDFAVAVLFAGACFGWTGRKEQPHPEPSTHPPSRTPEPPAHPPSRMPEPPAHPPSRMQRLLAAPFSIA